MASTPAPGSSPTPDGRTPDPRPGPDLAATSPAGSPGTKSTSAADTIPLTTGAAGDATRLTTPGASAPAPLDATRLTGGPKASAPPAADATRPTHPVDGTAATLPAGADRHDAIATMPAGTIGDQRTVAATDASPPFGSSTPASAASSSASSAYARSSFTQRVSRTKLNRSLPPDAQVLDAKLQVSRPSVLADLVSSRRESPLPPGVKKLIEEQGTEGRYAINKELAHGGMGAVLDISDHDFRRRAAMKVILSQYANSHEAMERFLAEAQVTAQLEHPNIVPIHDLGVMEDGTLYFTMKMIEGISLGRVVKLLQQQAGLLKRDGQIVPPDDESRAAAAHWTLQHKLHVFLKVLDGVGFAHSKGVIHRDIKPDNIMLGAHGEVLVVDWGIAKVMGQNSPAAPRPADAEAKTAMPGAVESPTPIGTAVVSVRSDEQAQATMAGAAMGTVYYMPPEQAQGELEKIDARADIYALGATLYELLALKRSLRPGANMAEMLAAIIEGRFVALDEAAPGIDKDLVAIVHRAMAREPGNRYASCEAFADDIRRYLAGAAVLARTRTAREIVAMWIAQNRTRILATAVVAMLVVVAAVGTSALIRAQNRRQAASMLAQAQATLATLPPMPSSEQLHPIAEDLTAARAKDNTNPAIESTLLQVHDALAIAIQREEELANRKARHEQAERLLNAAIADQRIGGPKALAKALDEYTRAHDYEDSPAIEKGLAEVDLQLQNINRLKRQEELNGYANEARTTLLQANSLPPAAPAVDSLLTDAENKLALADQDTNIKVDGLTKLFELAQKLRAQHEAALAQQQDLERGRKLAASAGAALQARRVDEAMRAAEQALGFAPHESTVLATYRAIAAAKLAADQAAAELRRRQDAEARAQPLLAAAAGQVNEAERQHGALLQAEDDAERLERELADRPLDEKKALFLARAAADAARSHEAGARREAEQRAEQVLSLLEPWAQGDTPPASYLQAEAILAGIYHQQLRQARARHAADEVALMTQLLRKADRFAHAYAADFLDTGLVTVSGPRDGSLVTAHLLQVSPDGRLLPTAQPPLTIPLGTPQRLAVGSWQFTAGSTIISVPVTAERPLDIHLPERVPSLPGIALRYVPGDLHVDRRGAPMPLRPFWLSTTEITYAQYLAFLRDPATMTRIRKELVGVMRDAHKDRTGARPLQSLTIVPVDDAGIPQYKLLFRDAEDFSTFEQIDLDPSYSGTMPIAIISRQMAEEYCEWLSEHAHLRVRLPSRVEWQFAATGDDPLRVYPWGPTFDGNFCQCSAVKALGERQPIDPATADVGPFGHLNLAGGVREWLSDRNTAADQHAAGAHGALIAGGGWGDDNPMVMRTDYVESVPETTKFSQIGFRILVEAP